MDFPETLGSIKESLMRVPTVLQISISALVLVALSMSGFLRADESFDAEPILYSKTNPQNRVSIIRDRIKNGELNLNYSSEYGYLPALLDALEVPVESQMLVFSKTSMQMRRISPRTPRAIYFNDDVYVGFCQSGDLIEVSAVDPQLGTVFYTLDQSKTEQPMLIRRTGSCLVCHSSSRMEGVPGHVIRSLYVDSSGQLLLSGSDRLVDQTTPIEQRWGGWYVTGTHGSQKHLGNLVVRSRNVVEPVDNAEGQNVVDLKYRINPDRYLSTHSDIVALMVLEHQTLVQNRMTKANFDTRQALADSDVSSEYVTQRIRHTGDRLVEAILMVEEATIKEPIQGTSGFAEKFAQSGPRDKMGRSLRDLDLTTRMFKYPCSYLIYSDAFDKLPQQSRDYVLERLWDVLSGKDESEKFAHLSNTDRQAILEILRDTKSNLPGYWIK